MSASVPNTHAAATVSCTIEVYSYEGGKYHIAPGQIINLSVTKQIMGGRGPFNVVLAPGGPRGPNDPQQWSEIITPMSFVLIGMQRGAQASIIMAGVVTDIGDGETWSHQPPSVHRAFSFAGFDFGYFFTAFNWFAMTMLGMADGQAFGTALGLDAAGVPALISQGQFGGNSADSNNPVAIGRFWYEKIMTGKGKGILGNSYVPYQNNSRVKFEDAMATVWEDYKGVYVPFYEYAIASEGSWYDKFKLIFPFPWYEFFVTTAPSNLYGGGPGANVTKTAGYQFRMASMPAAAPVSPTLVARVNPTPNLKTTADGTGQALQFGGLDMARWNALPVFTEAGLPFSSANTQFSAAEAKNFYLLNPTFLRTMFGDSNTNVVPFMYYMMGAGDAASIQRYGYRPEITSLHWIADALGSVAENQSLNIPNNTVAQLMGRQIAHWHPLPLMASATVALSLRPDIYPGFRFRFPPFKSSSKTTWDFYITSVTHQYGFGMPGRTSLNLTRGLPTSVYNGSASGGVLESIHMGNAQRKDGQYRTGLPEGASKPLMSFGPPESIKEFMSNVAHIFVTPQEK